MMRRTSWKRCVGAVVIIGACVANAAVSASANVHWSLTPTANPGLLDSTFRGVSCPTATFCMAVGYTESNRHDGETFVEQWDGANWSLMSAPNPKPVALLSAVSCLSPKSCVAVGEVGTPGSTLVESWDGAEWTVVASPNVGFGQNTLQAVSCVSASECVAVGNSQTDSHALIETWDGVAWTISPSAKHFGPVSELSTVSCWAHNRCVAAGLATVNSQQLIEQWNGRKWSTMPNGAVGLWSVSCTSASWCVGVGPSTIATWDGSTWTTTPGPVRGGGTSLRAVACVSATQCTLVGSWTADHAHTYQVKTLVASWDGAAWTIVKSPSAPSERYSWVFAVSCADRHSCAAVGSANVAPRGTSLALVSS